MAVQAVRTQGVLALYNGLTAALGRQVSLPVTPSMGSVTRFIISTMHVNFVGVHVALQ